MKNLPLLSLRPEDITPGVSTILLDLVKAYVAQNFTQFDEYITAMPEEEGYAPTARQEVIEQICKEFITYLSNDKIPDIAPPNVSQLRTNTFHG